MSARVGGAPAVVTVPVGGAAVLVGLVVVDRRKWGAGETRYSWTQDTAEVERVADLIRRAGVTVGVTADEQDRPMLRYLNRDERPVRRVLRRAGIAPPPRSW